MGNIFDFSLACACAAHTCQTFWIFQFGANVKQLLNGYHKSVD